MTSPHFSKSIRTRITLWNIAILILTLLAFILATQLFLWRQLSRELETNLREEASEVARLFLKRAPDGHFVWKGHQPDTKQVYWVAVTQLDGMLIYRNFPRNDFTLPSIAPDDRGSTFHSLSLTSGERLLFLQEIRQIDGVDVVIRVGRATGLLVEEMWHLFFLQALSFPLVLLIAWAGGYFAAGRILAPLHRIINRMQSIGADQLHERLPADTSDDELGHLSRTFNHLLEKLDHAFTRMRQFTGDASHELRTPLAAMRSVGETALRAPLSAEKYQETIASMLEEGDRMSRLVNDLLTLARADHTTISSQLDNADLDAIVQEESDRLAVLAEEKGQSLELTLHPPCPVLLDRDIFRQAFANILHNAIQHSPQDATIRITVERKNEDCVVEIADAGPGIAPEHQARIFDRFYRVDKVRSRDTGGTGLGLAIADWAIRLHEGRIEVNSSPGQGTIFRILLPFRQKQKS